LASTASYISTGGGDIFANAYYVQKTGGGTPVSTGTANTAGSVTSNYLPVKINGTTYKILLYNL